MFSRKKYDSCSINKKEININTPEIINKLDKNYIPDNKYIFDKNNITNPYTDNLLLILGKQHNGMLIPYELNNKKEINQLCHRPYLGSFKGAGTSTMNVDEIDIETKLFQRSVDSTNFKIKPCSSTRNGSFERYEYLPEFGNPQKIEHIIPPNVCDGGWIRSGIPTRDYYRREDYYRRCVKNKNNIKLI